MNATTTNPATIVFITGAFVTHRVWDEWLSWFEGKGYKCIAPAWPHKDGTAQELRNRPNDTELAGLRLRQILDHYIAIIKEFPEKPFVIGHSLGGLLAQLLVNRDLVKGGIAIQSVPPKGVVSFEWAFIRLIRTPFGVFTPAKKTFLMSLDEWKHGFTKGMNENEQTDAYEKYATPESKLVLRDTLGKAAKVDFKKPHPPLLLISGTNNHIIPEAVNYNNYLRYSNENSFTDYKEFKGNNHFIAKLSAWQEETEYIANWLQIVNV